MQDADRPSGPGAEAPPALESRIAQSPLIVTGTVEAMSGDRAQIRVKKVLKGSAQPGGIVAVSTQTPPAVGPLSVGDTGVWLVSGSGDPPGLLGGGPVGVTEDEVRSALGGS